jgi:hypothetical protein
MTVERLMAQLRDLIRIAATSAIVGPLSVPRGTGSDEAQQSSS